MKFTAAFDAAFATEGIQVLRTPVEAPKANAYAERWVGTVRRQALDRMLIFGRHQLVSVLAEYADHDNVHRPHRALEQGPPLLRGEAAAAAGSAGRVVRRDRPARWVQTRTTAAHHSFISGMDSGIHRALN
jgi:putative transposase